VQNELEVSSNDCRYADRERFGVADGGYKCVVYHGVLDNKHDVSFLVDNCGR